MIWFGLVRQDWTDPGAPIGETTRIGKVGQPNIVVTLVKSKAKKLLCSYNIEKIKRVAKFAEKLLYSSLLKQSN